MSRWRPIEEAKHDGSPLLLAFMGVDGLWQQKTGRRFRDYKDWIVDGEDAGRRKPLYWMPLPPNPNMPG